jgi:hypothetical protein
MVVIVAEEAVEGHVAAADMVEAVAVAATMEVTVMDLELATMAIV